MMEKINKMLLRLLISGILALVLCSGCRSLDAQTEPQVRYAEDRLENGLMWMFEKGLPMYYSKVSLEEQAFLSSPDGQKLSTEETNRLRNHEDIVKMYTEKGVSVDEYIAPNEPFHLLFFRLKTNVDYEVFCYLRDIQDTVIEYWVVEPGWAWAYIGESSRVDDKQLFFITVADTITAPRRVVIRSDQFVETAEVGGRTVQFPRDNLYILYSLHARAFPRSYLNSDLADYEVVMKWEGDPKRPYDPSLKKMGKIKRFFYNRKWLGRGYIGKSRIVYR